MSSSNNPFLTEYEIFPEIKEEPKQFLIKISTVCQNIAFRVNKRDIGIYEADLEVQNGQQFFGSTPQVKRDGFRKVLQTGTLSTGANTVAHGITFPIPNTFHFTRIYGVLEDATPPTLYVPIPDDVTKVTVNPTNINITIPAGYNGFSGIMVLEYVKTN